MGISLEFLKAIPLLAGLLFTFHASYNLTQPKRKAYSSNEPTLDTGAMNWSRQERKQAAALSGGKILLEGTLVLLLLRRSLESTVSELGRGVDPLEADLLEGFSGGLGEHGLSESHDSLLGTRDRTLDHDEVVVDLTIADEATETIKVLAIVSRYLARLGQHTE